MRLADKVAIVTGGASGIGAAIVARFAAEGATAVAADLSLAGGLAPVGQSVFSHGLDVSDPDSVAELTEAVVKRFGRIDILVNSAGIGRDVPFLETGIDLFDKIIAVNLRGTFLMGQAAARVMSDQKKGAILNIASVSGRIGNKGRSAYGASKGGVVTLTEVMAVDLAGHGIRVNCIAPGPIDTPLAMAMHDPEQRRTWTEMTPLGRYGSPEELANAALFLSSDEASYVTGHILHVDGGLLASRMLVPKPV